MYRYEYETVRVGGGFWIDNRDCKHRDIIEARAREGWRFAGYVPTMFSSEGGTKELDLIFEREEADGAG